MEVSRRGFLGAMLVACAAPVIVRAESLMRIKPVVSDSQRLLTFDEITREAMKLLHQKIRFEMTRQHDGFDFAYPGSKILTIRRPLTYGVQG